MTDSVIVYSTATCPRCIELKAYLKEKGVPYEEKSLEDIDILTELAMEHIFVTEAPLLQVGDEYVFSKSMIQRDGELNQRYVEEILLHHGAI